MTATVTAVAMLLLTLILQLLLARITARDVDQVLADRSDAVIGSIRADPTRTRLIVPDSTLDAGVAVYDATGALVAGSAPESLRESYAELSLTRAERVETVDERVRVLAMPFRLAAGPSGVVVVTEKLEPYEEAERLALIVSLVTGLLATAATAAIAAWATRRALVPVAEMASTAAGWSERDLGRRFDLGAPDNELSALASTLDTLLDKVSAAIRSEQRLTSELAHELRTPLTTIQGTAELMLMRDRLSPAARRDLTEISAANQRMAATITTLLDLARNERAVVEASRCALADVLAEVDRDAPVSHVELSPAQRELHLALPQTLAVRAVAPVVANALRYARSHVTITAEIVERGYVDIRVDDDGPGLETLDADAIFEPGMTSRTRGAGLGLAISRRIARSAGGEVSLAGSSNGSTRFVVRLPVL